MKSQGWILPTNHELLLEAPSYISMISEILFSCWGAVTANDPRENEDGSHTPTTTTPSFRANAIISNPVTYGHVHCAEALGVPIHLMFPQPWVPTKAFPHPLSFFNPGDGWSIQNYLSYHMIDRVLWISMEQEVNRFRRDVLGLQPIWMALNQGGHNFVDICKVPFVKMWSPYLVPKPKDWGEHIDVVGSLFDVEEENNAAASDSGIDLREIVRDASGFSPSPELVHFLEGRPAISHCGLLQNEFVLRGKPIFLGFGSMVVNESQVHKLVHMVLRAAALAGVRILVQSGWGNVISHEKFYEYAKEASEYAKVASDSGIYDDNIFPDLFGNISSNEHNSGSSSPIWASLFGGSLPVNKAQFELPGGWSAESDAFLLGPCPHSWLFPRVLAVVHHGGAGTTAAGLRASKPTMICPFFGDQHFWGHRIHAAGLGPKPCPAVRLSETLLAESFALLTQQEFQEAARVMGLKLKEEDGVSNTVEAFYRNLPFCSMICEVSLFLGEIRLADVYCEQCGLNMNAEVCEKIHWGGRDNLNCTSSNEESLFDNPFLDR